MFSFLRRKAPAEIVATGLLFLTWQHDDGDLATSFAKATGVDVARAHAEILLLRLWACTLAMSSCESQQPKILDRILGEFHLCNALYSGFAEELGHDIYVRGALERTTLLLRRSEDEFKVRYPKQFSQILTNRRYATSSSAVLQERFASYAQAFDEAGRNQVDGFKAVGFVFVRALGGTRHPVVAVTAFALLCSDFKMVREYLASTRIK